jgi:TrmH family RNA methyltransferase
MTRVKTIESTSNSYFKTLLKLLKSQGIKKEKLFLVMGSKIVHEVLKNPDLEDQLQTTLVFDEEQERRVGFHKKVLFLAKDLFQELDVFDTGAPILVMQLPPIPLWTKSEPDGLELFLPVQDPANLGAIVRSAVAFNIKKIILLKESANPFHPKAVKASSGMTLKMNFEVGPSIQDLDQDLKNAYSLDMDGELINDFKWPKDISLVVGEEGQGLPSALLKNVLSIPIAPACESLNVMAATSIALYQWSQR